MFIRILALLISFIAIPSDAEAAPVPKPPKMDPKTIAAFEKIEGKYGVIVTGPNGYLTFDSTKEGIAGGGLPSFWLPVVKEGAVPPSLPPVNIPFGLALSDSYYSGFTKEIAESPNLKTIIFGSYVSRNDQLNNLIHAKGLTALRFSYGGTNDKALKIVGQLKTLNRLEIDWSPDVTAIGWQYLTELKELTSFKSDFSKFTDTEMKIVRNWSNLRLLWINSDFITDAGVLELTSLKNLVA